MDKILVVDFGSQYNQLIVRRIRSLGVFSELVSVEQAQLQIGNDKSIKGIIFSGGPNSVYDNNSPKIDPSVYKKNIPILGICYGMQLIAQQLGGEVTQISKKEYGNTKISINESPLTKSLPASQIVWMSHGDFVKKIPNDFATYGSSQTCKHVIMGNAHKKIYGVQFHPEVSHSVYGNVFLKNFIQNICGIADNSWNMRSFIQTESERINKLVGKDDQVLCALSGGVDSAVTAAIIAKTIGSHLTCLFVNHGLLRKNEANQVIATFKNKFEVNFIAIDASKLFLSRLKQITNPERKRKIIGKEFINIFQEQLKKIKNLKWLAQGTLYTDIIESGTKTANKIKSHHNVGGIPKNMKLKLLEPLSTLFKDEVRVLGKELGLPDNIINRQPFPGPGLAIRIVGEITAEKLNIVREADWILHDEIKKHNLNDKIWQYFAVLPNVRTVGVKGDQRSYDHVVAIRAVTSRDGMTADYAKIPYDVLDIISNRIVNEVKGVGRVVYDITSKPPGTIEWE